MWNVSILVSQGLYLHIYLINLREMKNPIGKQAQMLFSAIYFSFLKIRYCSFVNPLSHGGYKNEENFTRIHVIGLFGNEPSQKRFYSNFVAKLSKNCPKSIKIYIRMALVMGCPDL